MSKPGFSQPDLFAAPQKPRQVDARFCWTEIAVGKRGDWNRCRLCCFEGTETPEPGCNWCGGTGKYRLAV